MARRGLFPGTGSGRSRGFTGADDIDITPMIDCVFLLLIFFMVSSTMQGNVELDVPPAGYTTGIDARGASVLTIRNPERTGQRPVVYLGDGGGRTAELDELRQFVDEAVKAGRPRIVVKAEGDVPHAVVNDVAQTITSINGAELYLGVKDQADE